MTAWLVKGGFQYGVNKEFVRKKVLGGYKITIHGGVTEIQRSPQNSDPCILYAIMIAMTRKMSLFCTNYNPIKFTFCNIDEVHYKWTGDCVPMN